MLSFRTVTLATWIVFYACNTEASKNRTIHTTSAASPTLSPSRTKTFGSASTVVLPTTSSTFTTDYSPQALSSLWSQVGPVATAAVTTTVSPTQDPSPFPTPGGYHPLFQTFGQLANVRLPKNFAWGVASSAFQIEGAVNAEGRGPSIWDLAQHRFPGWIADNSTADITANQYYFYKQDFERLHALGIPYYSFSISWPRIFPFGNGPVNQQGLAHYDDVLNSMKQYGIIPHIILFHWETPLALFNEYYGWTSPNVVDDFVNYAKVVITRYDKYTPVWYTFNEPFYCGLEYGSWPDGYFPKFGISGPQAIYLCGHYTLLAHAKIVDWYRHEFNGTKRITFKTGGALYVPMTNSAYDAAATNRSTEITLLGWFNHPVWVDGDYPPTSARVAAVPNFASCVQNPADPAYPTCATLTQVSDSGYDLGPAADPGASWLKSTPTGIRQLLNQVMQLYPKIPDITISEFGFAEPFERLFTDPADQRWDLRRTDFFQGYLDSILAAMHYDHIKISGIFAWSIIDNFEWQSGLSTRFGLQGYNTTTFERYPKASMFQFINWFQQHIYGVTSSDITYGYANLK